MQIQERTFTQRVVLHRNGDPIHFDVTVDFGRVAEELGAKAEFNRSHIAVVAGGAVKVEHIR
jgi:hypothetical protein